MDHFVEKPPSSYPGWRIALQIFGQFRCAKKVFETNVQNVRNIFGAEAQINVFILSQKDPSSTETIQQQLYIRNILSKYDMRVIFYQYTEDIDGLLSDETEIQNKYNDRVLSLEDKHGHDWFVCKLWKRRHILNKLFNAADNESYDYVVHCRLFDISFQLLRPFDFLRRDDDSLYLSMDTFFMGCRETITKFLNFGQNMADNLHYYHDIWTNPEFCETYKKWDSCLFNVKPTYCSEVQASYHIYKHFATYLQLRHDYNSEVPIQESKDYLHIKIVR